MRNLRRLNCCFRIETYLGGRYCLHIKIIRENVSFKDVWIHLLESALRYKIYRENGFLVENATERYIHFKKLYPDLSERVPQRHIATYLGIAPESLSRIRSAMKENETDCLLCYNGNRLVH